DGAVVDKGHGPNHREMNAPRLLKFLVHWRVIAIAKSPAERVSTGYPFLSEREATIDSFKCGSVCQTSKGFTDLLFAPGPSCG
ncbi:hypothetical protein JTE90_022531, partial [Oedothorax gibbosus]